MSRTVIILCCASVLTGCVSTVPTVEINSFNRADMSVVLSAQFDAAQDDAARALKPSYDKFGAPKRYVSGNMSAVYETTGTLLYGSGNIHARFSPIRPMFWQIEGETLAASVDPIKTVHLLYDKAELAQVEFNQIETEVRRGQNFTVFERDLGARVVVSIYPTKKLSDNADLKTITFQN